MKVTLAPEQMFVEDALMLMAGVTFAVTTIVILLLTATAGVKQVRDDVISQVTTSPFTNTEEEKAAAFTPCDMPFTFQL